MASRRRLLKEQQCTISIHTQALIPEIDRDRNTIDAMESVAALRAVIPKGGLRAVSRNDITRRVHVSEP